MSNAHWEKIGKAFSSLPPPPPNERFVQDVMRQIRIAEERPKTSWTEFWKIPALGFGLAAVLLAFLTVAWPPTASMESYLLDNFQDPLVSKWVSETDASKDPAPDEVLQFALEDPNQDSAGGNL